jgi:hypothetical protein
VLEDILNIAPASESRFVHFEIGLQYSKEFIWHLKEKSTNEFGFTGTSRGISIGLGSEIKPELGAEDRGRNTHMCLRTRRQATKAGTMVRRNPRRAVRGPGTLA